MSSGRSFMMAAQSATEEKAAEYERPVYEFVDEVVSVDENGDEQVERSVRQIETSYPGEGPLALMIASINTDSSENPIGAALAFLDTTMSQADYRFIRKALRENRVDFDMLMDMIQDMVETWSTFPTKPQRGSTRSQPATGTRSTGRAPGSGSTRSSSRRAGS